MAFVATARTDDAADALISEYATHNPELGTIPNVEMEIKVTSDAPIRKLPYKVPFKLLEPMKDEIKRLMKLGVVVESESSYASASFPILKRNGKIRLIEDYCTINSVTVKDAHPFPNMWEEVQSIPRSEFFSQIDLSMGYHQIRIAPDSRKYTAFVTPFDQYEYCRIPFGLCNAPRVFQRTMRGMLGHLPFTRIFLDDILIFSETRDSHKDHLRQVLTILKTNNVSINFEKSNFFKTEVCYLGNIIDNRGFRADISRIQDMASFDCPRTIWQLQKLCGHINWFLPYVRNLSQRLLPITNKLNSKQQFTWSAEDSSTVKQVFEEIKQ